MVRKKAGPVTRIMRCNSFRRRTVRAQNHAAHSGFTLIELMIVVAIIAIILTLALPVYTNYTIRAKMGEAMAAAAAAKTALSSTCLEDPTLTGLTASAAGYKFTASTWVQSIEISGDCSEPVITMHTQNTGAPGDPEIFLTGTVADGVGVINWTCTSTAENYHLPANCRST